MKKSKHPNSDSNPAKDAPVIVEIVPHPPSPSEAEENDRSPQFLDFVFFVAIACCIAVIASVFPQCKKWGLEMWNLFSNH